MLVPREQGKENIDRDGEITEIVRESLAEEAQVVGISFCESVWRGLTTSGTKSCVFRGPRLELQGKWRKSRDKFVFSSPPLPFLFSPASTTVAC